MNYEAARDDYFKAVSALHMFTVTSGLTEYLLFIGPVPPARPAQAIWDEYARLTTAKEDALIQWLQAGREEDFPGQLAALLARTINAVGPH